MRKLILLISMALPLAIIVPAVSAHFPATSGTISAELHVEPDDSPVAGKPQQLYLILSDAANRFSLADCACELSISKGNEGIYYAPLKLPPVNQPTVYSTTGVPFTFPSAGEYHLMVNGQPLTTGTFQPFSLNWNLQVPAAPRTGSDFSAGNFLKYFAAILGIFVLVAALVYILS